MAEKKEIYASTRIKSEGSYIEVGEKVDPNRFTKEQLKQLYDAGSLEIRTVTVEEEKPAGPDTSVTKTEDPKSPDSANKATENEVVKTQEPAKSAMPTKSTETKK